MRSKDYTKRLRDRIASQSVSGTLPRSSIRWLCDTERNSPWNYWHCLRDKEEEIHAIARIEQNKISSFTTFPEAELEGLMFTLITHSLEKIERDGYLYAEVECVESPRQYDLLAKMGFQLSRNAFARTPCTDFPVLGYYGFAPQSPAVLSEEELQLRFEFFDREAEDAPQAQPLHVQEQRAWLTTDNTLLLDKRFWVFRVSFGAGSRMYIRVYANEALFLHGLQTDTHMQQAGLVTLSPQIMYFDELVRQ